MSNREFTATRTMLANGFATAGAELLDYMGTAAALAAIPNTEPPRYVVAGTLAMIAKVLPSADVQAAATVLTDERIDEIARKECDEEKYGFIFNKDGRFSVNSFARAIEAEVLAHAGVTAEPAAIKLDDIEQYRMQMAAIGTASFGYWKEGDSIHPDYDTVTLRDVAKLYAKYETLHAQVPAAEVRTAEDEQEECWSADQENFNAMSLGELIDCNDELAPGMTVWVADAVRPSSKHLIDADDVIELMGERAFDIARENAEDYPDVSDAEKAELDAILKSWIDRACPPNFWRVKNIRPYILSADDFPDDATPIEASFAAPSTADSANTGAMGEKGAE